LISERVGRAVQEGGDHRTFTTPARRDRTGRLQGPLRRLAPSIADRAAWHLDRESLVPFGNAAGQTSEVSLGAIPAADWTAAPSHARYLHFVDARIAPHETPGRALSHTDDAEATV
jgi:hypothetical protein